MNLSHGSVTAVTTRALPHSHRREATPLLSAVQSSGWTLSSAELNVF